jgi:leader peptidase (prepilin peptidase)/N-methyltransferase
MTPLRVALFGLFGLPIGSFLTVAVTRVPARESVVAPRSKCPSCGSEIAPRDNIPVVSWILLRGRCRSCGMRISAMYPLLELITAGLFIAAALRFNGLWIAVMVATFSALMTVIGIIDWNHKIIPNAIVYRALPAFAVYIVVAALAHATLSPLDAMIGFVAYGGALLLVAIVSSRGMGMGDVKLVALIGLVLGSLGLELVLVAAGVGILLGGIGAIVALLLGATGKQAIPFGPFLAIGAVVAAFYGSALANLYLRLLR